MKPFINQSLLLGGFYFFISYIIGYFAGEKAKMIELIVITLLLITVIVLAFRKSFAPLAAFWKKFPKISTYLAALGIIKYFSIIFGGIPGAIDGFILASARIRSCISLITKPIFRPLFLYTGLCSGVLCSEQRILPFSRTLN